MALTNNLKPLLDLPVWEWLRQSPNTMANITPIIAPTVKHRYIYQTSTGGSTQPLRMGRYDAYADSWSRNSLLASTTQNQNQSNLYTPGVAVSMNWGHMFRALATTSTTVTGALLSGQQLQGATIKVLEGTGAGQTRTITSLADNVIADKGVITSSTLSGSTNFIVDSNKAWTVNQWAGYQLKFVNSNADGAPTVRTILYNNATTLFFYDVSWSSHSALEWGQNWHSFAIGNRYEIESSVATIDSPWTVQPDITSHIVCQTGMIWVVVSDGTTSASSRMINTAYDIAADRWRFQQTSQHITSQDANISAVAIEHIGSPNATGTSTGASTSTVLQDSGTPGWATNRWSNYIVEITGGTGVGQRRQIVSNTSSALTVTPPFSITPDGTSTYQVIPDFDKIYMVNNYAVQMWQFSVRSQMMTRSAQLDFGVLRSLSALRGSGENPLEAFSLTSISRVGTTATATTTISHNFRAGDTVTVAGASGADAALYNGTFVIASVPSVTTFTYTMSGTPVSSPATFTASSSGLIVDVTKNWTVNEHVNKVVTFQNMSLKDGSGVGTGVITANTATTLTFTNSINATPSSITTYVICSGRQFFHDSTSGNPATNNGVSTGGSTSTVVDSTKSWVTNEHAGKTILLHNSSGTASHSNQDYTIASNTSNTITISGVTAATINASTSYSILNVPGQLSRYPAGSNNLIFTANSTDANIKGRYIYMIRGYGLARYNIATEQIDYPATPGFNFNTSSDTACASVYDGEDRIYIADGSSSIESGLIYYLDIKTGVLNQFSAIPYPASASSSNAQRLAIVKGDDGLKYLYATRPGGTEFFRALLFT